MAVVTISATYGAGGSWLAPEVARRLEVPFVDRAIPAAIAARLERPVDEIIAAEESMRTGLARLMGELAAVGGLWGAPLAPDAAADPALGEAYRRESAEEIRRLAATGSGVFLGRGAVFVLREHEGALHVRVDGPPARRVVQAMRLREMDRATAERELRRADQARAAYVKHFFRCDSRDPALYHLWLDTTALPLETCIELIVAAARVRAEA